jgi:hypothetical protein
MTADWSRAIDAKADLVRWWRRKDGLDWGRDFIWHFLDQDARAQPDAREYCDSWARLQSRLLLDSPPYYVTADMSALVSAAAAVMPAEPFLPTDPLDEQGFVYFAERVTTPGALLTKPTRAVSWYRLPGEGASGTLVVSYQDKRTVEVVDEDGQPDEDPDLSKFAALIPTRAFQFWDGNTLIGADAEQARLIKALWTIAGQRIVHVTSARPGRATVRRLEREQLPVEPVRVVTLRRRDTVDPAIDQRPVDWSHRWIVSGHWRNQYLPSVQAHRLQWIAEHVKGPEDKPLVVKEDVFRLAR